MYFSASHKNVKKKQDYTAYTQDSLIVCDGIGEFNDSAKVAELVADKVKKNGDIETVIEELRREIPNGGTTILFAKKRSSTNSKLKYLDIEYLGNGGIIHLQGNFADNPNNQIPYRYAEIMLPHINPKSELDKHFSYNNNAEDSITTKLSLSLNQTSGDILIFYTDGISSLENEIILKDTNKRYWRYQSNAIQSILIELDKFLSDKKQNTTIKALKEFLDETLDKLLKDNMLDDDASIGVVITQEVLEYYKSRK